MPRNENSPRSFFKGNHYLPPPSKSRRTNKGKPHKLPREKSASKIEDARLKMEKNQLRLLSYALCVQSFARSRPDLVAILKGFNEDMRDALKNRYQREIEAASNDKP